MGIEGRNFGKVLPVLASLALMAGCNKDQSSKVEGRAAAYAGEVAGVGVEPDDEDIGGDEVDTTEVREDIKAKTDVKIITPEEVLAECVSTRDSMKSAIASAMMDLQRMSCDIANGEKSAEVCATMDHIYPLEQADTFLTCGKVLDGHDDFDSIMTAAKCVDVATVKNHKVAVKVFANLNFANVEPFDSEDLREAVAQTIGRTVLARIVECVNLELPQKDGQLKGLRSMQRDLTAFADARKAERDLFKKVELERQQLKLRDLKAKIDGYKRK
jgi:hypothetical protein